MRYLKWPEGVMHLVRWFSGLMLARNAAYFARHSDLRPILNRIPRSANKPALCINLLMHIL